MKKKVLFVRAYYGMNIHSDAHGEYGTLLYGRDVFPDLSFLCAATIYRDSGYADVTVIDAVTRNMLPDDLIKEIIATDYDQMIIKTSCAGLHSDLALAKEVKLHRSEEILIAGHAAMSLANYLRNNTAVDDVITVPLDEYAYETAYGVKGSVNDMPTPDYTLVDYKKYIDDGGSIRLTLYASKGCPMSCGFCPYTHYYKRFEYRDIDKVVEDLKFVEKLKPDVIQFRDQFFTARKDRVRELCNRIIDEGIKLNWICETRLDSLDEELVLLMKKAGMFMVCFGIESGNPKILEHYNSKKGEMPKQKKMVDFLNSNGILTMAFYIIGFPEEDFASMQMTYSYADKLDSTIAAFNEYMQLVPDGGGEFDSPDVFVSFDNSTKAGKKGILTRDEVHFAARLFRTMYTLKHDGLKQAYEYNYVLEEKLAAKMSRMAEHKDDLYELSRILREELL